LSRSDAAMVQAAVLAEKVAAFNIRSLAGELNKKPTDGASLDE
jgi:hypothetical protein